MDGTKQYSVEYHMSLTSDVKNYCRSIGADLVGIADLRPLKSGLPVLPQDLLEPYTYARSLAVRLDDTIINGIIDGPTPE